MERIAPAFKRNPLGIPTFLLGGAFLSGLVGLLQEAFNVFGSSSAVQVIATVALFLIAAVASWAFLRGAGVAHRRVALSTNKPLASLYETIGGAGEPPGDQAGFFAVLSIALTIRTLLVIPIGLAITVLS